MATPIQPTIGRPVRPPSEKLPCSPCIKSDTGVRTPSRVPPRNLERNRIDEDLRRDRPFVFTPTARDPHGRGIAGDERHAEACGLLAQNRRRVPRQ